MAVNRIEIPAAAHDVFAVLGDGFSFGDWVVGTPPVRIHDASEVIDVDPPTYLHLRASMGPAGVADVVFELAETPRGTVVTMTETVAGVDVSSGIGWRADRLLRVRNSEVLWRLRRLVEQRTPGARRRDPVAPPTVPTALARALVRIFAFAASVRDTRSLHARGLLFEGRATLHGATPPLGGSTELRAVVRLSRGAGLSEPLPDFDGIAVRLLDAHGPGMHQDLLFVASGGAPVLRHTIRPTRRFSTVGFSTVLPYRQRGRGLVLFRVDPLPVATLEEAAAHLPFELRVSSASLLGPWTREATVEVGSAFEDDPGIRFDPWITGPDLVPAGLLNRARVAAYAGSRAASASRAFPAERPDGTEPNNVPDETNSEGAET